MLNRKAFTLVEILLVIVILGILAAVVVPRVTYSKKDAQIAACDANVAALRTAIELYHHDEGSWPANLDALNPDYIDEVPECPFGTAYTIDINHRVPKHNHS